MPPMKRESPEIEKLLEASGLSTLQLARWMASGTDHELLPDDETPDVLEEIEMARGMALLMDDGGQSE